MIKIEIEIENKLSESQGMLMCIVAIRTGLKVNLNDLETLRRNKIVDFYEMRKDNSELVFYWRGIDMNGKKKVDLALLQEFQVENPMPIIVSSYLYYDKAGSLISKII